MAVTIKTIEPKQGHRRFPPSPLEDLRSQTANATPIGCLPSWTTNEAF